VHEEAILDICDTVGHVEVHGGPPVTARVGHAGASDFGVGLVHGVAQQSWNGQLPNSNPSRGGIRCVCPIRNVSGLLVMCKLLAYLQAPVAHRVSPLPFQTAIDINLIHRRENRKSQEPASKSAWRFAPDGALGIVVATATYAGSICTSVASFHPTHSNSH